jgi:hypothetical protein
MSITIIIERNKSHYLPITSHQLSSEILPFDDKHKISWSPCGLNTILIQVTQIFGCKLMCREWVKGDFFSNFDKGKWKNMFYFIGVSNK